MNSKGRPIRWIVSITAVVFVFFVVLYLFPKNGVHPILLRQGMGSLEKIEHPGLPNCYRVDQTLIRGGQPTSEGFAELKRMGVQIVVNFRGSNAEEKEVLSSGMEYIHLPVLTFVPSRKKFSHFLKLTAAPDRLVFVHCRHGADRTGTAVALHRIFHQGWSREDALAEMTSGPFGFHGIHKHLKRFLRHFHYSGPVRRSKQE